MIRRLAAICALVLALVPLAPSPVQAQMIRYIPPAGTYTGGTITSPILAPSADNCASVPYSFSGDTNTGVCSSAADTVVLRAGGVSALACDGSAFCTMPAGIGLIGGATSTTGAGIGALFGGVSFGADAVLGWTSTNPNGSQDVKLYRDAANTLALRNGTNGQLARFYSSHTDGSNGSWLELSAGHASSYFGASYNSIVGTQNGSGVELPLIIGTKTQTISFAPGGGTAWTMTGVGTGQLYSATRQLTAGTMNLSSHPSTETLTHSYDWTNAMVVALGAGLTGDVTVGTIPAKTQVVDMAVVITGQGAGTTTLTVACGRTGAGYIDYIVASDAKAAANTVYGDTAGERGTNLTGYDLPSYTSTTDLKCHFVSTGANLDQVTGSTGRVILTTRLLP